MKHIYAPWRTKYLEKTPGACVFCAISKQASKDAQNRVFYRDEHCFGVMNAYPYTPGHIMFIPHYHTDSLEALAPDVWLRMAALAQRGADMLKAGFGAQGINIGMNLGEAGGAGISEHLHLHLVPRFLKDTNFISTIGGARVYPTDFEEIFTKMSALAKDFLKLD
ncbi:MAG: HIT family protein [Helicobacteraceae bacterium]